MDCYHCYRTFFRVTIVIAVLVIDSIIQDIGTRKPEEDMKEAVAIITQTVMNALGVYSRHLERYDGDVHRHFQ